MDQFKIRTKLDSLRNSQKKVQLKRSLPGKPMNNGFLIDVGRDWILLQQFHDFSPEGFIALRIKDLIRLRSGKYERHWEKMLAAEGFAALAKAPHDLQLNDTADILRTLQKHKFSVIVECEDSPREIWEFSIGQILLVEDDALYFAHFDGMGRWLDKPHTIPLDEITSIEFETPYIQTFSKYLNGPCPHLRPHAT